MNTRFTEFDFGLSLLSSMYHQDWRNSGDWTAIVEILLWEEQVPAAAWALYEDAVAFGRLSLPGVEAVWLASTDGQFVFGQDVKSVDDWLAVIREKCRIWLEARGAFVASHNAFPSISGVTDGVGSKVLALMNWTILDQNYVKEIGALRRLAELASPDLAFRLFLRIIDTRRMAISSQVYSKLVLIGRSLNYGEFVVSSLEYLVSDTGG